MGGLHKEKQHMVAVRKDVHARLRMFSKMRNVAIGEVIASAVFLPPGATEWLSAGQRGVSSETIFSHLTGLPMQGSKYPPADGSDLRRCRLLLAAVPEFSARLLEMRTVSPQWAALVEHWDELCMIQDNERDGLAPSGSTYRRMCELTERRR